MVIFIPKKNVPMPAGVTLLSPWTDLKGIVESRTTRDATAPTFTGKVINALASFYMGTEDLQNPLLSPIYADLHDCHPCALMSVITKSFWLCI
ncbi:hypothetical protein KSB_42530 [Ktedonobacter robiniae]|uniref:Alpha/beta hydrolase fold-3 domain-containing protein n=1 Tax=Ktedonobacter robiniae TaxID=2778365 RepID=A0ABQ3USU8_9CHLR|nr:hypothetical protein KSB_42530 [Ktedonobacter robiniae]